MLVSTQQKERERAAGQPIRVGDKFVSAAGQWEVIRALPGGRVEIFDRTRTVFATRHSREIRGWPRAALSKSTGGANV